MDEYLIGKCQFKRSSEIYAVYYRTGNQGIPLWTLIWVDDVLWIGNPNAIRAAKEELGERFPLKDLGRVHFFLGMMITGHPHERKIVLLQDQYIVTIPELFGFRERHTLWTPLEPGAVLVSNPEPDAQQIQPCTAAYWEVQCTLFYTLSPT